MNNTSSPDSNTSTSKPTSMTFSSLVMWCIAFSALNVIIVTLNVLTLLVFFTSKRLLRKRLNHFLVLLAITDMIVGLVVIPLYIYQLVSWWENDHHVLRNALFNLFTAMDILCGFASIFTLVVIAGDRVYAICLPLSHKVAPKGLYWFMMSLVWILPGLLVMYYILSTFNLVPKKVFIYLFFCSISVSLLVICVSYVLVWLRVKCFKISHRLKGPCFREKRLAEMLFLVTLVFTFTWLPFHVLNFIFYFCSSQVCQPSSSLVQFSKLLHYSNSFLNPIIYSYRNSEFRKGFKMLLKRITSNPRT